MPLYQFHFVGRDGERPTLDFSDRPGDGEAVHEGFIQLERHGSARGVEIWEGERLVAWLERPEAEVLSAAGRQTGAGSSQPLRRPVTRASVPQPSP